MPLSSRLDGDSRSLVVEEVSKVKKRHWFSGNSLAGVDVFSCLGDLELSYLCVWSPLTRGAH